MFKVSFIEADNVGATAGQYIAMKNLADVFLNDINEGAAMGKALDLLQTGPSNSHCSQLSGAGGCEATTNSDVVTNPLDVMTKLTYQVTGLPSRRVIGMAGVLDSARFQAFVAAELHISPVDVKAMVLGGHGGLMVPLKTTELKALQKSAAAIEKKIVAMNDLSGWGKALEVVK